MVSNSNINFRRVTAVYPCLFEFVFGFLVIGATICIQRESWCLPYAVFSLNGPHWANSVIELP